MQTATTPSLSTSRPERSLGTVVRVRGSVIDARFDHGLPDLHNELRAGDEGAVIVEVVNHLNANTLRGIALTPTQGLARGSAVVDSGGPLRVPVGRHLLGRAWYEPDPQAFIFALELLAGRLLGGPQAKEKGQR